MGAGTEKIKNASWSRRYENSNFTRFVDDIEDRRWTRATIMNKSIKTSTKEEEEKGGGR